MKILFCILCIFFSTLVQGATYNAVYEAQGLNMTLLSADMKLTIDDNTYAMRTTAEAQGILAMFIHQNTIFDTTGKITSNGLRITDSMMQTRSGKQIKTVRPNLKDKPDYIDYQSVLIELINMENVKEKTLMISDGKRDMRATLTYEGERELPKIYPSLSGNAEVWSVRIDVISGKKKGWFFERLRESQVSPLRLYMQPSELTGKKMLVLSTFDTGVLGSLYIVLKEFKNAENQ